jgi:NTE family protein
MADMSEAAHPPGPDPEGTLPRDPSPTSGPPLESRGGPLALVMGGGGARAVYQVGFLRAVAKVIPELEIPIITGVSAGAINAAYLAAHPGTFAEAVEDLGQLWGSLSLDQVFQVDSRHLAVNVVRWGLQLVSGGLAGPARIRSLVDTAPLERFLTRTLTDGSGAIPGIADKIRSGRLRALAVSTSSFSTGQSITWVQGRGVTEWMRPQRRARLTTIGLEHVMASASIPVFFPAVQIGEEWYSDGGLRLAAPLSPALHLGAERILSISTRFDRLAREAEQPVIREYPPPAQVIGALMNSIFLDQLDQDAWRVETMNSVLRRLDLRVTSVGSRRSSSPAFPRSFVS